MLEDLTLGAGLVVMAALIVWWAGFGFRAPRLRGQGKAKQSSHA